MSLKQDSSIAAYFFFATHHQEDYIFRLQQEKRGLDSIWLTKKNGQKILIVLMPLTDRAGLESYRMRVNALLHKEFLIELNSKEIRLKTSQLSEFKTPLLLLLDLLK